MLWLERQARILLGCPHHHIIFTVPDLYNELWLANRRVLSRLLFTAARDALSVARRNAIRWSSMTCARGGSSVFVGPIDWDETGALALYESLGMVRACSLLKLAGWAVGVTARLPGSV